jgi:hypothetical protein
MIPQNGCLPLPQIRMARGYARGIIGPLIFNRLAIQHAGPKLSGYPTNATIRTTVAQNATLGFLRSVMVHVASEANRTVQHPK